MGYADHDDSPVKATATMDADVIERAGSVIGLLVRLIGVALLGVGIAVSLKVISEAFELYNNPQVIERFAEAIEQGSNLDAVLAPLEAEVKDAQTPRRERAPSLRLSYFAAWVVVLMLLVVVSGIAMAVVTTGGRLALADLSLRKRR